MPPVLTAASLSGFLNSPPDPNLPVSRKAYLYRFVSFAKVKPGGLCGRSTFSDADAPRNVDPKVAYFLLEKGGLV